MTVTVKRRISDPSAMKKALAKVELHLLDGNAQTFEKEGPGWKPLSLKTLEKRRKGRGSFGDKILQDSGTLKDSMTALGHPKGHRFNNSVDRVEVGTKVEYGKFHQDGTKRMVARPFATINSDTRSKIRKTLAKAFVDSL